uniref:Uncharacterized protein n=1 Tax=Acrobeloides nanus TaxID=290746 RepID=A0A914CFL5_9BILA
MEVYVSIHQIYKSECTKKFKGPPIDGWKAEIVEAAIEKKLHPNFDASEYEEDNIDDGIESIHDEDENMPGEDEEGPEDQEELENEKELKAQEEPEDSEYQKHT